MAYTFEITRISKLSGAHLGVLDGKLLDGTVIVGSVANLMHGEGHWPLHVKGVVLDSVVPVEGELSLTVDLREAAMKFAAVGDKLVCNDLSCGH
jgi:hypothetical protein